MDRYRHKGSITVFLSLTCILFLSLICTTVESARVQGAKAQTANITGIGNYSLLGEFERELLEQYNVFALDGSYGNGSFQISKVNERLQDFISYNANPKKDLLSVWCFDPWRLELTDSSVDGFALLTDDKGEPFYQQAVAYMKANAGVIAVDKLLEYTKDTDKIKRWQEEYEKSKNQSDQQISSLEGQKQQKLDQLESEAAASDGTVVVPAEPANNPLKEIAKLKKKSTLEIVTWDKEISDKEVKLGNLPSKSRKNKGNFSVEKEHSGVIADVLFREYLLMHFTNYLSEEGGKALNYQVEYLLAGKASDRNNLKYVVTRLLLIREGMNYLYCIQTPQISSQAGGLAITLTGFLGIPALTTATKHALLLAWAYGESLIDLRVLLDGGKVPIFKDAGSWSLSLENLGRITEILQQGASGSSSGITYEAYLRILLNMGSLNDQKMRALDVIQAELQKNESTSGFKAENCIVAVKTSTQWNCHPVFARLPAAVMGISAEEVRFAQKGSIAY